VTSNGSILANPPPGMINPAGSPYNAKGEQIEVVAKASLLATDDLCRRNCSSAGLIHNQQVAHENHNSIGKQPYDYKGPIRD